MGTKEWFDFFFNSSVKKETTRGAWLLVGYYRKGGSGGDNVCNNGYIFL